MLRRQTDAGVARAERLFEAETQPVLIAAGDERHSRRRADRGVRVALKETDATRGYTIDVGRLHVRPAVTGDVRVAEVVGHDVDDVGRRGALLAEDVFHFGGDGERAQGSRFQDVTACGRHA